MRRTLSALVLAMAAKDVWAASDIEALAAIVEPAGALAPRSKGTITFRARNNGPDAATTVGFGSTVAFPLSKLELYATPATPPCIYGQEEFPGDADVLVTFGLTAPVAVASGATVACTIGFAIPAGTKTGTTLSFRTVLDGQPTSPGDPLSVNNAGSVSLSLVASPVAVPTLRPPALLAVFLLVAAAAQLVRRHRSSRT